METPFYGTQVPPFCRENFKRDGIALALSAANVPPDCWLARSDMDLHAGHIKILVVHEALRTKYDKMIQKISRINNSALDGCGK